MPLHAHQRFPFMYCRIICVFFLFPAPPIAPTSSPSPRPLACPCFFHGREHDSWVSVARGLAKKKEEKKNRKKKGGEREREGENRL